MVSGRSKTPPGRRGSARAESLEEVPKPQLKDDAVYGENRKGDLRCTSTAATDIESRAQIQQKKRKTRLQAKADKLENAIQERRELKKKAGLLLCDARCPVTNRFCRCQYLPNQSKMLDKHMENGEHDFPVGMRAADKLALILSKPGGALANGSRSDRLNRPAVADVTEMAEETPATVAARCRAKFNRKGRTPPKQKTELMIKVMGELWRERPVLPPQIAHQRMAAMIDDKDGGLMFCHSKRGEVGKVPKSDTERWEEWAGCSMCGKKPCTGCNGWLPTVAEFKSYFSSLGQKRKKKSGKSAADDDNEPPKKKPKTTNTDG